MRRPWGSDCEPKHLLSEALPGVCSRWQACRSLVPPSPARQGPRRRSPELDQGPRLYPELRGPLGGGGGLPSGLSDQGSPRVRGFLTLVLRAAWEGPDLALPAPLARPGGPV